MGESDDGIDIDVENYWCDANNRGSYTYKIFVFRIVSKSLRTSSYFRDFPCI